MKLIKLLFGVLTITAALAMQVHAQEWLTNGLVAYYPFNGNANDESGNGRSLANSGAVLTTDRFGKPNSAFSFDGSSSMLLQTNNVDSLTLFDGCTLSCWVNLTDNARNYSLVRKDGDASIVVWNEYGRNSFYVEAYTNGGGFPTYTGFAEAPPLQQWCMLTATWNKTNFVQYINGQKKVTEQHSAVGNTLAAKISIGRSPIYNEPLLGNLDDVRIYNRALSDSEVQQLYAIEQPPRIDLIKALKPSCSYLSLGTNYQLQVSALNTWTNEGSPFTATNTSMVYPQYWDVDNWGQLFFRLQVSP